MGIARALATRPSILLADESTSALDPETTADVLQLLQEVNERMGVTIVVITHEMEVVRSIAQNVAVLDHGHLVETGTTGEIFAQPQSETTRRFVSTIVGQHPTEQQAARLREENPGARLVDVTSVDGAVFGTTLAKLADSVSFKIVHGGVIETRDGALGNYTVALTGPDDNVAKATDELSAISHTARSNPTQEADIHD